jgi:hypothetical protein
MKLLFVENRYVTWLWREVATRLQSDGHEIHWLVQNPIFAPRMGHVHTLRFPQPDAESAITAAPGKHAKLDSDRAVRHFGASRQHHGHYQRHIAAVIDEVAPDVVFGEPTQFHELITIEESRRRGIPYLFPTVTRYPPGRIAFHLYDTMETVGGCGVELSADDALALREAILQRRAIPSYMAPQRRSWWSRQRLRLSDKLRITAGWLLGERIATPSPWRKVALDRQQRALVARWEACARPSLPKELLERPWVLYAMQMQPESNIDVWGHPWSDQVAIVREAADALGAIGSVLIVKPNPKSKYELNEALCQLVATHRHIIPLTHDCKMSEVFPGATAVLSVTGTVLLECVLSGKPVGVLGTHAMSRYPGVTPLAHPAEIAGLVNKVTVQSPRTADPAASAALLARLYSASYEGTIYDPLNQPELATPSNLEHIVSAFRQVLALDSFDVTTTA